MTLYRLALPLQHPFTIARGTIDVQPSLLVELEHEGIRGYGEVTENSYYGHTFQSLSDSLTRIESRLDAYLEATPAELWSEMHDAMSGDMFALSAIDIAAHDLRGKMLGIPTWKDWGLEWSEVPQSSYTIGIDRVDTMVAKLAEQPEWGTYKIKLGTADDLAIIRELRKHTNAAFRVDANCGWTWEQTLENASALEELGVEFIEQPLPVDAPEEAKRRLFEESALPIIADEDCQVQADILRCASFYHGVNVKVCKCGGLTAAVAMLREASELRMKTMVGCMVESEVGISAAAQLLPLLDYADLDGAILLADSPCAGVCVAGGEVSLSELHGTGAEVNFEKLQRFVV